jgi:hypothetical protein
VVTCLINTATDWTRFKDADEAALAYDISLVLDVDAPSPQMAAEAAFAIGNRQGADTDGKTWPAWCRSLSTGDVVLVRGWNEAEWADLAVAGLGWTPVTLTNDAAWNCPGGRAKMAAAGHASAEVPA